MIRLVKSVFVISASSSSDEWTALPLVRGTASLKKKITQEKAGYLTTYTFTATLSRELPFLAFPKRAVIVFDDGEQLLLGNSDVPILFELEREYAIVASFKYETVGSI